MPIPNWMMSRTATPMQLPRSAARREAGVVGGASCWAMVTSCLPTLGAAGDVERDASGPRTGGGVVTGRSSRDMAVSREGQWVISSGGGVAGPAQTAGSGHHGAADDVEDRPGDPGGVIG